MNIAFFLIPKAEVVWFSSETLVEEAIQRLTQSGYTAVPLLDADGHYAGTISEGDLLRQVVRQGRDSLEHALRTPLCDLPRRARIRAVGIEAQVEELLDRALEQNFVPVIDSRGVFIGIVRRREILQRSAAALREGEDAGRAERGGAPPAAAERIAWVQTLGSR